MKMSKITLEFDAETEGEDARTALDGYKWKLAVWDIDQFLRSTVKYGKSPLVPDREATDDEVEVAEAIREELRTILESYNLQLD